MFRASRALRRDERHIELRPGCFASCATARSTSSRACAPTAWRSTTPTTGACCAHPPRHNPRRPASSAARFATCSPTSRPAGPAAPRAAAPRGRRHLACRARRRARRQRAGHEEPRPPRAHEPRQARGGALGRLPGCPPGAAGSTRRGPPRVGRDVPPRRDVPRLPHLPRWPEGHEPRRRDARPGPLLLIAIGVLAGKVGAAGAKSAMLKTGATAAAGAAIATGRGGRRRSRSSGRATRRRSPRRAWRCRRGTWRRARGFRPAPG